MEETEILIKSNTNCAFFFHHITDYTNITYYIILEWSHTTCFTTFDFIKSNSHIHIKFIFILINI